MKHECFKVSVVFMWDTCWPLALALTLSTCIVHLGVVSDLRNHKVACLSRVGFRQNLKITCIHLGSTYYLNKH